MIEDGRFENEFQYRLELFEQKFVRGSKADCWEWFAARTETGTGIVGLGKLAPTKTTSAAAASWFFYKDRSYSFGTNLRCIHLCRNKGCVNPDHLAIVEGDELPSDLTFLEFLAIRYPSAGELLREAARIVAEGRE